MAVPQAASGREESYIESSALADALFNSTQQRVLGLLFGQPDRSFFVNQIIALANSGRGAVQRELDRLAQSRLATVSKVGNQKHYQANRDTPLFHELCGIMRKTVGLGGPIRAALEPLGDKIALALLFGSAAKRKDTAMSDIDLLVVSDALELEDVLAALEPAEKLLDREINPVLYTSEGFRHRRAAEAGFLTRVLESPHLVLMGSPDAV